MTHKQAYLYTFAVFLLICLLSYATQAQEQKLSLRDVLQLTLTGNREIKISSFNAESANQQVQLARSQQLPVIGVTGLVSHYFQAPVFFGFSNSPQTGDKIPYGRFGGKDQVTALVYANQPVYNAATQPALEAARLRERQQRLLVTGSKVDVAARVKTAYLTVLLMQERLALQKESMARNEKALNDARSLLAQGKALRVDTLRAYTSLKNLEPDVLKLSNAIAVGKQELKRLMGMDSAVTIVLTDSLSLPASQPILSEDEVFNDAKSHRPDLLALDMQQQVADQQVRLAGAGLKPQVSLTAQYMLQTQTGNFNYFDAYYPSTPFIGAQVNVPLFNGYANKARIKQAKLDRDATGLRVKDAYESLRVAVKQVVASVGETAARIQTSANVKETAQLSYDITQYRYARGVASRLELTDAELALTTAQQNYLEAVYDHLAARIALEKVTGTVSQ